MRAAVTRIGGLEVTEVDEPVPGPGQVLVRSLACGICGSDLHAAADLRRFADLTAAAGGLGGPGGLDPDRGVVLGDEFAATLDRLGRRTLPAESLVTGVTGLDGVAAVFEALGRPGEHGKVLVRP